MMYLRYRWMILFAIVSFRLAVYGQPSPCTSDGECQAMLFPTCGRVTVGVCDRPANSSDCDYLGAGIGYMVTIGSLNVCTMVCSNNNDCANLPTAKICLLSGTSTICSECETTDDCGEMAFQYHSCTAGFCKGTSSGSNKCSFSSYCTDSADDGCYYDGARCWPECTAHNNPCEQATCITGIGVCSDNTNFPPSIICSSNSNCTTALPYCEGTTCRPCDTSDNSGCTSVTASQCVTSSLSYSCVACSTDTDCSQFTSTTYCEGGTCVQCLTSDNTGCTTVTAPVCVTSSATANICTGCTVNSDCTQFSSYPYCNAGTCGKCQTINNAGCTSISKPKCSSISYQCTTCSEDSDCTRFSSTPVCGTSGTCVACRTSNNSGCTNITTPRCISSGSSYSCTTCSANSECSRFSSTPYCTSQGACVQCLTSNNIGCTTITAPKCISPSNTCAACTLDSDCTQFPSTPYCGSTGTCVLCLTSNNSGCLAPTPYCNEDGCGRCRTSDNSGCTTITAPKCISPSYTCAACTLDSDCTQFSSNPYCGSGGTCVECLMSNNSGCTTVTAPKCISPSNTCAACTLDSDCTQFPSTPYCGSGGTCVECLTSNNSGCTTITAPKCISPSNTCAACTLDSDCSQFPSNPYCGEAGTCMECLTSNNSGCTTITAPKCSSLSNTCAACTLDSDCTQFPSTPYCRSGGSCVECLTSNNSGCTAPTPYCNEDGCGACKTSDNSGCTTIVAPKCTSPSYICTTCSTDSDCTQFSSTPYCGGGTCVVCRTKDNSGCTTISAPVCSSSTYSCTTCSADTDCTRLSSTPYCGTAGTCVQDKTSDHYASLGGKISNVVTQAQTVASSIVPIISGGTSTSAILLVGFLADVGLFEYLNVPFPDNFVSFCQEINTPVFPNMFAKLDVTNGGNNPNSTIGKFQFWGVSTVLLDNSYVSVGRELIILGIILGLNILVLILIRCHRHYQTVSKVRIMFTWNIFLSYYLGDFSELQLNSMIQMRENYVSSGYADLSLAFAVLIVATYPPLFGYILYKLNKRPPQQQKTQLQQQRGQQQLQNNFMTQSLKSQTTRQQKESINPTSRNQHKNKWASVPPSIKILVEDLNDKTFFTRNFIVIMLLQTFLQILIVFSLQDYGLTQAVLYTMIVLTFLYWTVRQRPYKSISQMSILFMNLITRVIMGIIAIVFKLNDKSELISQTMIDLIGLFLISLILIVEVTNLVISVVMMVVSVYKKCKEWREKHKNDSSNLESKEANLTERRHNNSTGELNESRSANISLDLHNGSNLQASHHLQHRICEEDEAHSQSQANPGPLIPQNQIIDLSGAELARKRTRRSSSIRNMINDHIGDQMSHEHKNYHSNPRKI